MSWQALRRVSLWLFLICSLSSRCFALGDSNEITQYVQTALTDKTGLPQNSVNAIDHTHDGYFWFGTQEGLARFDGLHIEVFDTIHYKGLKDNYIQDLAAARRAAASGSAPAAALPATKMASSRPISPQPHPSTP